MMSDGITGKLESNMPTARDFVRQMNYGTAVGLTRTAKEAQAAVQGALRGKFTIRKAWMGQNTPVGIKITPATPGTQFAEVYTQAPFLPRHEEGGIKIPHRHWLAIPAPNGPLNKARIIPDALKPKALEASGKSFIITTKTGLHLLAVRNFKSGRGKFAQKGAVIVMYLLVPRAKIKKVDIFYKPIKTVVDRRMLSNISEEVNKALAKTEARG